MFSRPVLRTVQSTTVKRATSLRAAPARTFASPANDGRPPVYLHGLDGTYATALVRRNCIVLVVNLSSC